MHIHIIPNRKSTPAILLRESFRENGKVKKRTVANLSLPDLLDLEGVDEDDIYEAMDWLLARQRRIEKKLSKRHLADDDLVLYDLTSSYFEGVTCPLARLGKSRDRKRNTLQVNYGLVADRRGCPVAVSVFEGNFLSMLTYYVQWHMLEAWRPPPEHDNARHLPRARRRRPVAYLHHRHYAQREAKTRPQTARRDLGVDRTSV
jgi:hypothetical protein